MRKYIVLLILCSTIIILGVTTTVAPTFYKDFPVVNIFVDGKEIVSNDVPAFQIDGRTMVPLRLVGEALNMEVEWDQVAQAVRITRPVVEEPEEPSEELIEIYDIATKNYAVEWTEVSGIVKNNHDKWVTLRFTVYFYDEKGELGHVHVTIDDIAPGDKTEFYSEAKGDLGRYVRKEIIIDKLEWS